MLNASVVDQDVHLPKTLGSSLHHVFNLCRFAHVSAVVEGLDAQRLYRLLGLCVVTKAIEHDVGTLLGQSGGQTQTNATRGARYQSGFAF